MSKTTIELIAQEAERATKASRGMVRLYDQNTMWMLFDNFTAALKALWHYTDAESYRRANVQLRVLDKLTRAFQEDNATIRRELLIRGIALATTLIEDKQ
jgi:hypothetical protein